MLSRALHAAGGAGGSSSKGGRLSGRGSKELVRAPSKSEATQDKKSRTGKSKDRVSKKDGAGARPAHSTSLVRIMVIRVPATFHKLQQDLAGLSPF